MEGWIASKVARKSLQRLIEAPSMQELVDDGLAALAEDLGASLVVLYRICDDGIEGVSPRSMQSAPMQVYASHYFAACPLQEVKRRHNPGVAVVSDMISASVARRSAVFHDFYRPNGIERQLSVRLSAEPYGRAGCRGIVFCRSGRDRPWRDREVEEVKRARPLLASILERNARLEALKATARERDLLAAALAGVGGPPRLIFDRDARLVWMSPGAAAVLGRASRGGGDVGAPLREAVRQLLALGAGSLVPASVMQPVDTGDAAPIVATLLLLRAERGGDPLVLACLPGCEETAQPGQAAAAARAFGLSRAEAAVLEVLLLGKRNVDIARHLFISTDTVRTHLKQIYKKMGVGSRLAAIVKAHELQRA